MPIQQNRTTGTTPRPEAPQQLASAKLPSAPSALETALAQNERDTRRPSPQAAAPATKPQEIAYYRVREGDNLSTIATRFGLKVAAVTGANPGLDPDRLRPGQPLRLPNLSNAFHIIHPGESFSSIAAAHKLSTQALERANPGLNPKKLQIGDAIALPAKANTPEVAPEKAVAMAQQKIPTQRETNPSESAIPLTTTLTSKVSLGDLPAKFFASMIETLNKEGGLSRDKYDTAHLSGVPLTNMGITGVAMKQHIKTTEHRECSNAEAAERIATLTTQDAIQVYANGFWRDDFKLVAPQVAFIMFDWGVNSGSVTPIRQLQKHLKLPVTGAIDSPLTTKLNAMGPQAACEALTECRRNFYESLVEARKTDPRLVKPDKVEEQKRLAALERTGAAWLDRCDATHQYALSPRYNALTQIFESTKSKGCDLFDPVATGSVVLKRGSAERSLIRILQERLNEVGYSLDRDGRWAAKTDDAVRLFKQQYNLPGGLEWGKPETAVLNAVRQSRQLAKN